MSKNIRELLKEQTLPYHEKLENTKISSKLAKAELTKDEYIMYLKNMKALHDTIEPFMCSFDEFEKYGLNPKKRTRIDLVKKDLDILNSSDEIPPLDIKNLKTPLEFESAIAWMYVLEGSTMGGGFLAPRLSHFKGANDEVATNYFLAYKENTPVMWKEFIMFLEKINEDENVDKKKITAASINLFKHLIEVMDESC